MKIGTIIAAVLLLSMAAAAQILAPAQGGDDKAREVVQMLAAGQFDKVEAQFDEPMSGALPHGKLEAGWNAIVGEIGAFENFQHETTSPGTSLPKSSVILRDGLRRKANRCSTTHRTRRGVANQVRRVSPHPTHLWALCAVWYATDSDRKRAQPFSRALRTH
jgi:hypothetical protein